MALDYISQLSLKSGVEEIKKAPRLQNPIFREFRRVLFLYWAQYIALKYDPRLGQWWWPHKPRVAGGPGAGHDPAGGRIRAMDWILGKPSFSPGPGWRISYQICLNPINGSPRCIQATPALRGPRALPREGRRPDSRRPLKK
jgi:hypothetical protein